MQGFHHEMPEPFLRKPQVLMMTGWSNSTLHRRIRAGEFPEGIKITERIRVWPQSTIVKWQHQKIAEAENN